MLLTQIIAATATDDTEATTDDTQSKPNDELWTYLNAINLLTLFCFSIECKHEWTKKKNK